MRPQVMKRIPAPVLAKGVGCRDAGIISTTSRHRRTRVAAVRQAVFQSQIIVICD